MSQVPIIVKNNALFQIPQSNILIISSATAKPVPVSGCRNALNQKKIEELDPCAYTEKYQVTLACAISIQRLRETTSPKIRDYLQLLVGGSDVWSSKKGLNFIENLDHKNELITTVNIYIEETTEKNMENK